jgi:hypothetical protein
LALLPQHRCPMLTPGHGRNLAAAPRMNRTWPARQSKPAAVPSSSRAAPPLRYARAAPRRRFDMPAPRRAAASICPRGKGGANSARHRACHCVGGPSTSRVAASQPRTKDEANSRPPRPQARTVPPLRWRGPCGRATAAPNYHPPWKGCAPADCRFACPPSVEPLAPRSAPRWGLCLACSITSG